MSQSDMILAHLQSGGSQPDLFDLRYPNASGRNAIVWRVKT